MWIPFTSYTSTQCYYPYLPTIYNLSLALLFILWLLHSCFPLIPSHTKSDLFKMFITQSNFPFLRLFNSFLFLPEIKKISTPYKCQCPKWLSKLPKPHANLCFSQQAPAPILPFFLFLGHISLFLPRSGLSSFYLPGLHLASFFQQAHLSFWICSHSLLFFPPTLITFYHTTVFSSP